MKITIIPAFVRSIFFISAALSIISCASQKSTTATTEKLIYSGDIEAKGLTKTEIISRVNKWAVNNYKNYSSVVQQNNPSSLAINGVTSVFLTYEGSHTRQVEEDSYNYQIRVTANDQTCTLTLNNYISTRPNSTLLTSKINRLKYIENMDAGKRRKKILTQYAEDEYSQLDKHAADIFRAVEKSINKPI